MPHLPVTNLVTNLLQKFVTYEAGYRENWLGYGPRFILPCTLSAPVGRLWIYVAQNDRKELYDLITILCDRFFHDVGEKIEENETTLSFAHLAQSHYFSGFWTQDPRKNENLNFSNLVFLPYEIFNSKIILKEFENFLKNSSQDSLNKLVVKNHPTKLNSNKHIKIKLQLESIMEHY